MYPVLFRIGSLTVDTYNVVWFIALLLAIWWVIRRLEIYGLDEYEARRIMAVSFFCMMIGAIIFKQLHRIPYIISNPSYLLKFQQWGVSEFGAVLGAFISAFVMCMFSRNISFLKLCDAAAPPAMLAIAVGRWGCFFHGCCVGLPSKIFVAVHFPRDPAGLTRHPVQIYYSVIAIVIVFILLHVERRILPRQKNSNRYYSVIAPMAMIMYTFMRFGVAVARDYHPFSWLIAYSMTYKILTMVFPFLCLWLAYSLLRLKSAEII